MGNAGFRVEVATGFEAFRGLRETWNALADRARPAPIHLSHEWLLLGWMTGRRRPWHRLIAVLVSDSDGPLMAGAFVESWRRFGPATYMLDAGIPQRHDLLFRPANHMVLAAAAQSLLAGLGGASRLSRRGIVSDADATSPLVAAARSAGAFQHRSTDHGADLDLSPFSGPEAYLATRSRSLRSDHHRQMRHLAALPGFAFRRETGTGRHRALDWLLASKARWLRDQRAWVDWIDSGRAGRFLHAMLDVPRNGQRLQIDTLSSEGRFIAACLSFEEGDTLRLGIISHDPDLARHSPGRTLVITQIGDAIARGYRRFDLGLGALDWKSRLTDGHYETISGRIALR